MRLPFMLHRSLITVFRNSRAELIAGLTGLAFFAALPVAASAHGDHDARIAAILERLKANPDDPALHYDLARTNREHGDWQISLLNLDRVDALAPGKFSTDLERAQSWMAGGDPAKAKAPIDRFVSTYPDVPAGWLWRARVQAKLKAEKESLADYREALKRTPSAEPELIYEVVEIMEVLHLPEEAADLIDGHLKRLGNNPGLVMKALELETAVGRYDAALARIDEIQKAAPRPEPWMARRASLLAQAGRINDSVAAWKALFAHLQALPAAERSAHSMLMIAEQAQTALASLASRSNDPTRPSLP